jgi:hypothetical protein
MTKRLTVALLCAAATFALAGTATAEARVLSYRTARALAKELALKQVHGRDVVTFHLLRPKRLSSTRFAFLYDDRTRGNVYCTARIIVASVTRGRTTTVSARFAGQRCNGIPDDVLKFEAITRAAQRDVRRHTQETLDAIDGLKRANRSCRKLKVPRSRVDELQYLLDIAATEAVERPNDAALGTFVDRLQHSGVQNARLAAGAAAWADYLALLRSLPTIDNPCKAFGDWQATGYSANAAPVDFAARRALNRRANRDARSVIRAARFMLARGAFPHAAVGFSINGLLPSE